MIGSYGQPQGLPLPCGHGVRKGPRPMPFQAEGGRLVSNSKQTEHGCPRPPSPSPTPLRPQPPDALENSRRLRRNAPPRPPAPRGRAGGPIAGLTQEGRSPEARGSGQPWQGARHGPAPQRANRPQARQAAGGGDTWRRSLDNRDFPLRSPRARLSNDIPSKWPGTTLPRNLGVWGRRPQNTSRSKASGLEQQPTENSNNKALH